VLEVGAAPAHPADDVGLVVVGGPTHAFGLSRPQTRQDAAKQAGNAVISATIGLREWIEALDRPAGTPAAAFDTRVGRGRVPGSAARAAQRRLTGKGFRPIARPESFYVGGTPGPLLDGELARAREWGASLGSLLEAGAATTPAAPAERRGWALRVTLGLLTLFVGVNAVWGGAMLMADSWALSGDWLARTPFDSWFLPGLALLLLIGGTQLAASASLLTARRYARAVAVVAGAVLAGWIVVQLAWLQVFHPVLQPLMLAIGVLTVVLARRLPGEPVDSVSTAA
jgi:hypothetical protein